MLVRGLSKGIWRPILSHQIRYASHGSSFNEPSGNLFGEKPLSPGQKRQKEGWENIWYIGMYGSMGLFTIVYLFKPERDIQSWALEEAKKRLLERGETLEYPRS